MGWEQKWASSLSELRKIPARDHNENGSASWFSTMFEAQMEELQDHVDL